MATTHAVLAGAVLDAVEATGTTYAVLHREAGIAGGAVLSDVDVAVDRTPWTVLAAMAPILSTVDLRLVLLWPYDVGALTSFWMTADGTGGVQLDLLGDPAGHGRYGLRTRPLLRHRVRGERWYRLDEAAERVYLAAKRDLKRDRARLRAVRDMPEPLRRRALGVAGEVTAPWCRQRLVALLEGHDPGGPARRAPVRWAHLARAADRLAKPVGFWVAVEAGAASRSADVLLAAFGRVLPHAVGIRGRSAAALARIEYGRRRPALLLSCPVPGRRADLLLPVGTADPVAAVVAAMADGAERRLRFT